MNQRLHKICSALIVGILAGVAEGVFAGTAYTSELNQSERREFHAGNLQMRSSLQNGCPSQVNNISSLISENGTSFTLIFDDFLAELNEGFFSSVSTCAIDVHFQIPPGRRLALESLDLRGYANIDSGVRADVAVSYFFPDNRISSLGKRSLNGFHDDSFLMSIGSVASRKPNYSPCTGSYSQKATIVTTIGIERQPGYQNLLGGGFVAVDSLDGSFANGDIQHLGATRGLLQQFRISWERCLEYFDPVEWCGNEGGCVVTHFEDIWYKHTREVATDLKDLGRDIKESFKDDMDDLKRQTLRRYGQDSHQYEQFLLMEPKYDKLVQKIRDETFDLADKYKGGNTVKKSRKKIIEYIDTITNWRDRKKEDTYLWLSDTTEDLINDLDDLVRTVRD